MSRTPARRLMSSIFASEWAIRPEWLEQFAGIASQVGEGPKGALTAEEIRQEIRRSLATLDEGRTRPSALAIDYGESLGPDTRATMRSGVAIIPVMGPLFHYADELHDVCGCSSYAQIAVDIGAVRAATARGRVSAVILDVDSPGGEVGGCGEAAAMIALLASEMPVITYVSDLAASAAYWLSVAADEVWIAPSALLGSIGVVAAFRRRGAGGDLIEIVSSQSPKKRPDVETDAGRAQVRATLDALAQVFIDAVAQYRGTTSADVASNFGEGDLLVGERAAQLGMANRIGHLEELIAYLSGPGSARVKLRPAASAVVRTTAQQEPSMNEQAKPAETQKPTIDRAYLNAHHPQLVAEIRAEGVTEGTTAAAAEGGAATVAAVTAERERIQAVYSLMLDGAGKPKTSAKGLEEVILAAVADPKVTKAEAALRLLDAREAKDSRAQQGHLAALKKDEADTTVAPSGDAESGKDDQLDGLRRAGAMRKGKAAAAAARN